jgi:hypothetical protein
METWKTTSPPGKENGKIQKDEGHGAIWFLHFGSSFFILPSSNFILCRNSPTPPEGLSALRKFLLVFSPFCIYTESKLIAGKCK